MTLDSEECLQLHCVERQSEPLLEEINVFQASACESDRLIQSVVVLVEAQSRRSLLRILCTCAYLFVSLCCSHVTCTDDPHRLKCAIKSQVIS